MTILINMITPEILNELDDHCEYCSEQTPMRIFHFEDALTILFTLPIITGLGFSLPFLGFYSVLGLGVFVFASWLFGETIARLYRRYQSKQRL